MFPRHAGDLPRTPKNEASSKIAAEEAGNLIADVGPQLGY